MQSTPLLRGDLDGRAPTMVWVPAGWGGEHVARADAVRALMVGLEPALAGASDDFLARHYRAHARNLGHYRVAKAPPGERMTLELEYTETSGKQVVRLDGQVVGHVLKVGRRWVGRPEGNSRLSPSKPSASAAAHALVDGLKAGTLGGRQPLAGGRKQMARGAVAGKQLVGHTARSLAARDFLAAAWKTQEGRAVRRALEEAALAAGAKLPPPVAGEED